MVVVFYCSCTFGDNWMNKVRMVVDAYLVDDIDTVEHVGSFFG